VSADSLHASRAALGDAAVFPLGVAAKLLGGRRADAIAWLEAHCHPWEHPITGDRWVTWGRVRAALESREAAHAVLEDNAAILARLPRRKRA
jgi:hypothetical protein